MKNNRRIRQRLLNKLYEAGYESETSIKKIDVHEFMSLPNIVLGDISTFLELQMAVRQNKIVSYLSGLDLDLSPKKKVKKTKLKDVEDLITGDESVNEKGLGEVEGNGE